MSQKYTLRQRLQYRFENSLSKGVISLIIYLASITVVIVLLSAIIITLGRIAEEGSQPLGFIEGAWQALMRAVDAGNLQNDNGWSIRFIYLLVTVGGIFFMSSFIGILTNGMQEKLEELRKGRSTVIEKNHTLILGWSSKIFPIISELVIANESVKKPCIVILADKDKVEMEDEIRHQVPNRKNTRIICRTGSSLDIADLEIVNHQEARSVIILTPDIESPDFFVIKSVLALTNNPRRRTGPYHIVAEIQDIENLEAARLVGGDEAVYVYSADLIARVAAQTCRQSGLSIVYSELLDFGGAEIYFKSEPSLSGKPFKDALFAYTDSSLMGIMRSSGEVLINPSMATFLEKDDQLIGIAEDDSTFKLSGLTNYLIDENYIIERPVSAYESEKNLVIGWNQSAETIIRELDSYVQPGSELLLLYEDKEVENEVLSYQKDLKNQKLIFRAGKTTDRATLESIDFSEFNDIIILGNHAVDIQESDAKTLITLLHLRNISTRSGKPMKIVSEMYDIKNRNLAEVTKADDFIISDRMISLMISQLSENKHLKKVFDELFQAEGSEIYLKPASDYVKTNVEINFFTILESAARKNEIAIGYRLIEHEHDSSKSYGVVVNPVKSNKLKFTEKDKIIVIALD